MAYYDISTHNERLDRFEQSFRRLPHPGNSTRIASGKHIGVISGNGNHCDYFVGELREYDGTRHSIEAFYEHRAVLGQRVRVLFVSTSKFHADAAAALPNTFDEVSDWAQSVPDPYDNLYLVYVIEIGALSGLDVRCR